MAGAQSAAISTISIRFFVESICSAHSATRKYYIKTEGRQLTRQRERQMRRFNSAAHAQVSCRCMALY